MEYEPIIGLEVHVQLNTKSKIFCSCENKFSHSPNTNTCPICQGHPGVLPVFNKEVLLKAIKAGLALNCEIAQFSKFDRKHYYYPDLPKNYQISQYDLPICKKGYIEITLDNGMKKKIGITRLHMEEDAGKLIHSENPKLNESYVDLNRTGTPLAEIVSEPEIYSSEEAYKYLTNLKTILKYIDVSDCIMEEGSLRCDANVSIRPKGEKKFGTKTEVKNMNSFKGVQKALEYEIKRQVKQLEKGEKIIQETRLYDAEQDKTFSMRSKEEAQDYRYFPDPDLVPIITSSELIEEIKKTIPELHYKRYERFINDYGITPYDAEVITETKELADYYEKAVKSYPKQPKKIANWIMTEVMRNLNEMGISIINFPIAPEEIGNIFKLIDSGEISGKIAKTIFDEMISTKKSVKEIIEKQGLKQISNEDEIRKIIDEVIAENLDSVEKIRQGNKKPMGHLVGQVMKKTQGQANPQIVNKILEENFSK